MSIEARTRTQLEKMPRLSAGELLPEATHEIVLIVEDAMNAEWWRGFHAGVDSERSRCLSVFDRFDDAPNAQRNAIEDGSE